jgi:hypothetical protein
MDKTERGIGRVNLWLAIYLYVFLYVAFYLLLPTKAAVSWFLYFPPLLTMLFATFMTGLAWQASFWSLRSAWFWLFMGSGLWLSAEITWGVQDILIVSGTPDVSLADGLWLVGYLVVGMSVVACQRHASDSQDNVWKYVLAIGGVVALGLFLVLLWPAFRNGELRGGLSTVVTAIYPTLDLFLAIGGMAMLRASRRKAWKSPWLLIAAAFLLWAFSDAWYWILIYVGHYGNNLRSVISVGIPDTLGNVLVGVAAWQWLREQRVET